MKIKQTLAAAIEHANRLGYPYAVQEWKDAHGGVSDYIVAHGSGDGIGLTVYATIPNEVARFNSLLDEFSNIRQTRRES